MKKWIKYQIEQIGEEGQSILVEKKIGYNKWNVEVAKREAYNGVYEVIEEENELETPPLIVSFGGTGSNTPKGARENLELLPELIWENDDTSEEFASGDLEVNFSLEGYKRIKVVFDYCPMKKAEYEFMLGEEGSSEEYEVTFVQFMGSEVRLYSRSITCYYNRIKLGNCTYSTPGTAEAPIDNHSIIPYKVYAYLY